MLYDIASTNDQWNKTISTIIYLNNKSLTKLLKRITLYNSDIGIKLNLSDLQKFGYLAYYHNKDSKHIKLSNQYIKYIFFYYENYNQYRL